MTTEQVDLCNYQKLAPVVISIKLLAYTYTATLPHPVLAMMAATRDSDVGPRLMRYRRLSTVGYLENHERRALAGRFKLPRSRGYRTSCEDMASSD